MSWNYSRKPTQLELCESGRRRVASKMEGMSFLLRPENRPTPEELQRLRAKRPHLWNGFPA